ncbi:hypothetical protein GGR50DRAFT_350815 [Xylaria sp. CBS 124048]|nr:hypothetical protein GGR50DRAFT_350815 [Xylaria sp. CBS 124048]
MALAAAYQQFLAAPDASHLAENATLNYITTTTVFRGSSNILQHLNTLRRQIKKKRENVLSIVHGQNAIATEMDTGLEFITSGASYLPTLDDNFLADRTVSLPIMHVVTFNDAGKILNIRQSWDQGALLKQVDVIGKSGLNWPIRDSAEQIKMIENCVKAASGSSSANSQSSTAIPDRSGGKNAMRDPHASLSLFQSREELEFNQAAVISPRGGARPRQRDFVEILGDEPTDAPDSPSTGRPSFSSPSKAIAPRGGPRPRQRDLTEILGDEPIDGSESLDRAKSPNAVAPKAGSGKKFQPNRLFESNQVHEDLPEDIKSPDHHYRPHPEKYSHFEFADGSDAQDAPTHPQNSTPVKTKHTSQWSFDDFVTPAKVQPSKTLHHQEGRKWDLGNNEVPETPLVPRKARPDAAPHFEFVDDGDKVADPRPARPRGATQISGLSLYQNNLYDEDGNGNGNASTEGQQPLGTITNRKDRGRDFGAHWGITDNMTPEKPKPKVSDDRQKAVKMMEANWAAYDESPVQKENKPSVSRNGTGMNDERGISVGGDGMGGGKGSNRNWFFGGGDETGEAAQAPPTKKAPASKTGGFNWDF